jgi:hypothetical protein
MSIYAAQLKVWVAAFSPDQFLLLSFTDYLDDPSQTLLDIAAHLVLPTIHCTIRCTMHCSTPGTTHYKLYHTLYYSLQHTWYYPLYIVPYAVLCIAAHLVVARYTSTQ